MKTLTQFLTERYINLFSAQDKTPLADEVFSLLQTSYQKIGGIKGSGFSSPEDMIQKIPFWKLVKRNGKIVAGAMYKDSDGRKRVAVFTDGTESGKTALAGIYKEDFSRAFFEVSDSALGFIVKQVGVEFVEKYAKTPEQAEKILKEPVSKVPSSDPHLTKIPSLSRYFYQRKIGGSLKTKIMLGTNGKEIITLD